MTQETWHRWQAWLNGSSVGRAWNEAKRERESIERFIKMQKKASNRHMRWLYRKNPDLYKKLLQSGEEENPW